MNSQFYEDHSQNTNVIDCQQVRELFEELCPESVELLKQSIDQIDFKAIVDMLDESKVKQMMNWQSPQAPQGKKPQKSSIQKFTPGKGDILGVSNQFRGTLLIKNIKSKFVNHAFTFQEDKVSQLREPLNDLLSNRDVVDYKECRDLVAVNLSFELYSQSKQFQDPELLEQIKSVQLLKYVMCRSLLLDTETTLQPNGQLEYTGFLQRKFDNYVGEDVDKLTSFLNIRSPSEKFDDSVEIVQVDTNGELKDVLAEQTTIFDVINLLKNKRMDIVLSINSICMKRTGRDLLLMPKMQIIQIILHEYVSKSNQCIGLNLKK